MNEPGRQRKRSAGTKKWRTVHIPDLTGKVIIVTGGNTGIGFQAAKKLCAGGAETILACRNEKKAARAVQRIRKICPGAAVSYSRLDLGNLQSIKEFARNFKKNYSRLDLLLNNAGVILFPYRTTEDGFESQLGINHLGHFALTGHLSELLLKTGGARVISVSSNAHRHGRMDFDNFLFEGGKSYSRLAAYGRSKLANLLFTYELDRRFKMANSSAIAVAAHPGHSYTDFGRSKLARSLHLFLYPAIILFTQSAARGALPSVRAATDPEVKGSDYFGPGGRKQRRGFPVKVDSNEASRNAEDARKLWELSEELTGIRYLS